MDRFMAAAIEEARTSLAEGGIPIGAVCAGMNRRRSRNLRPTATVMQCWWRLKSGFDK